MISGNNKTQFVNSFVKLIFHYAFDCSIKICFLLIFVSGACFDCTFPITFLYIFQSSIEKSLESYRETLLHVKFIIKYHLKFAYKYYIKKLLNILVIKKEIIAISISVSCWKWQKIIRVVWCSTWSFWIINIFSWNSLYSTDNECYLFFWKNGWKYPKLYPNF